MDMTAQLIAPELVTTAASTRLPEQKETIHMIQMLGQEACSGQMHDLAHVLTHYPLARNQYINNSPGIFSCIRPGANTCAACIRTEINFPKIFLCIGIRDA